VPAKKEICGGPLYVFNNIERVERNREKELAIARQGKRKESVKTYCILQFHSLRVRISRSIPVTRRRKIGSNLRIANHPERGWSL